MASARHRCNCQVYGCISGSDPDPWTQIPVAGCLLPPSTVYQHRHDNKIWCAAKHCEHEELDLLVAAAVTETHSEAVVSLRACQSELGNEPTFVPNMPLEVCDEGIFTFFWKYGCLTN